MESSCLYSSLFKKQVGTLSLTVEEYAILLMEVEATWKCGPLCPRNTQTEDTLDVMTPGNYLIRRLLSALPEHPLKNIPMLSRKKRNMCQ